MSFGGRGQDLGDSMVLETRSEEFMNSQDRGSMPQEPVVPQRYKFNADELRVLRECNRESFYFRCLPIGTALGVGTYYAVRMGYLKPSAKWGAGPKMFLGSILGYFIGKISYQGKCAEKLMQLPNSPLADILRRQKGKMGFQESLAMEPGFVSAAPIATPAFPNSEYSQSEAGLFTDLGDTRPMGSYDTDSSVFTGVDYGKSYDTTQQMLNDDNLPQKKPQFVTSYDDLRKQNRDDFEHRHIGQSGISGGYETKKSSQTTQPPRESQIPSTPKSKNIYGDVWDDKQQ